VLSLWPVEPLRRVLAIGCHADDIEIGCGGTLLALARESPQLEVEWVVLAAQGDRAGEARASAETFLATVATSSVEILGFRDGFLPYLGAQVKDAFETLKSRVDPQLVFTHAGYDFHQDHRLACELTWNTFRNHVILEYEIPKVDGDLGRPNLYVPLSQEVVENKLDLLERHFPSQAGKHWFDRELFRGLMRLRGMECVAPDGYAEAFTARKVVISVGPSSPAPTHLSRSPSQNV
jgi:LmbE family N-acetylglucosaminyl deacetylase